MTRLFVFAFAFFIFTTLTTPAAAQNRRCSNSQLSDAFELIENQIPRIREAIDDGADLDALLDVFALMGDAFYQYRAICSGMQWTSDELDTTTAIEDVEFPEGVYLVRLQADGEVFVRPDVVEGDCTNTRWEFTGGVKSYTLFTSPGCTMALVISSDVSWILSITSMLTE